MATEYVYYNNGALTGNLTISNEMPITSITYTLQVHRNVTTYSYNHFFYLVNANSTTAPTWPTLTAQTNTGYIQPVTDFTYKRASTNSWIDIGSYNGGTTTSYKFRYYILYPQGNSSTSKPTRLNNSANSNTQVRVKAVITNSAGSTTIYSSAVTLN